MSQREHRNAAAFKRAAYLWDNASPPEQEEEGEEIDPQEAERDREAQQAEQLYWRNNE